MILKNAALAPDRLVDLKFENGLITRVDANLSLSNDEMSFDAEGRVVLPGLHDHHMHFMAYAASLASVDCSAASLQTRPALAQALRSRLEGSSEALRAIGYHEGNEELIDRRWLDQLSSNISIRVQHRTGRLWIYNSAAIADLLNAQVSEEIPEGAERHENGELTGRFFHMDDWLRKHSPRTTPDIAMASKTLASYGVTGFTDAGPDNDRSTWQLLKAAQQDGRLLQRVMMMGESELSFVDDAFMQLGACKIYLKESALPDYDKLCSTIKAQHERARAVAFHCVTSAELHYALAALKDCGVNEHDRVEHASVCDDDALEIIFSLGISVVSQPNFIAERGDRYLQSVPADEQSLLYRANSFIKRGIAFAGSTDAPFGNANPWLCMQAAIQRRTPSGIRINAAETLTAEQALKLFIGKAKDPGGAPRKLAVGEAADCCLLDTDWNGLQALGTAKLPAIAGTWISGKKVF